MLLQRPSGVPVGGELQQDLPAGVQLGPKGAGNQPRAWGQVHRQLPALVSGAPRGAAGHRAGTDGSTGAGRGYRSRGAKQDTPAQLRSGCPLPAAGLRLAGSGELAGAQHRQGGTEPNAPTMTTHLLSMGCRVGSPRTGVSWNMPAPQLLIQVFSRKLRSGEKPALLLSPWPSPGHSALSPSTHGP